MGTYLLKSMKILPNLTTEALLQLVFDGNSVFEGKGLAHRQLEGVTAWQAGIAPADT